MVKRTVWLGLTLGLAGLAAAARAQEVEVPAQADAAAQPDAGVKPDAEKSGRAYSLSELVQKTVTLSPELERATAGLDAARAKQDQANGARWPQIQALGAFGPSVEALGSVVDSPNRKSDPKINGVFVRFDVVAIQPLFTFGKISSLRQAATAGARVEEARIDQARADVVLRTTELYFGKLLTRDLLGLITDLTDGIGKSIERKESRIKAKMAGEDESDLYRLRTYLAFVTEARAEVVKNQQLATAALRSFAGLTADDPVDLDAPGLSVPSAPSEPDSASIAAGLQLRPEMRQAIAGVDATAALARSERSGLFPMLFLGVIGSAAVATNHDYQENPFVSDQVNDRWLGVGLGARYQLDFGITLGRIRQAWAENRQIAALKRLAELGIPVQVIAARRELDAALETVRQTEDGARNARRWLVVAQSNYDIGLGDVSDLGNAVEGYAKLRADYLMAIYRANVAVARLAQVTGRGGEPVAEPKSGG